MAQLPVIPGNPADKTSLDTNFENTNDNFTEVYTAVATKLTALMSLLSNLKIKGTAVVASGFIIDRLYEISSIGTTDFTLIGASSNTVGIQFTANGPGEGTGTALPIKNLVDDSASYGDANDDLALWSVEKIGELLGYKQDALGAVGTAGVYWLEETVLGLTGKYSPGTWRMFYSDGTPGVKEIAIEEAGKYLQSYGSGGPPVWAYPRLGGTVPASATAAGTAGDIMYDSTYFYVCVATNTWKRTLLETW